MSEFATVRFVAFYVITVGHGCIGYLLFGPQAATEFMTLGALIALGLLIASQEGETDD